MITYKSAHNKSVTGTYKKKYRKAFDYNIIKDVRKKKISVRILVQ